MSPSTLERLRRAGWSEGRAIDTVPITSVLTAHGYAIGAAVEEFLRSFGMIALEYPNARDVTQPDGCHFDAARATRNAVPSIVESWSARLRKPLVPIGEAFDEHLTLVMAHDGSVYGGYDDFLCKVGETGEDAIDALCTGRPPAEVAV